MKFCAEGTIRDNKTGNCTLISLKDMKKTERGTYDIAFDEINGVFMTG